MKKNLLSIFDLEPKMISDIIDKAFKLKKAGKSSVLSGKTLGLIFDKPSTRTQVSFAVAMYQLGGFPLTLNPKTLQRNRGETVSDTAKTLSRYMDGLVLRTFKHKDVEEFAKCSDIPVINGLTDLEHPCQVLGDLMTIMEERKLKTVSALKKLKIVFVGDGNNIANSWIAAAGTLGLNFVLARPNNYGPDIATLRKAKSLGSKTGAKILITSDPKAVSGADVIYTDVWISMGEESEERIRRRVFKPYQVNQKLLDQAKDNCMVMHCLPAVRGEEVTAQVIDGSNSIVFDQAENRLHIQKAILAALLA